MPSFWRIVNKVLQNAGIIIEVLDARMEEDLIGDFGTAYKDLFVYGAKVKDINRHQAAAGFWKF